MANMCYNKVEILGTPEEIKAVFDCIDNLTVWVTKFEAGSPDCGEDYIFFETRWSPVFDGTKELSLKFPNLTFVHKYEEGNSFFSGYAIYKAGKVVKAKEGDYGKYPLKGKVSV